MQVFCVCESVCECKRECKRERERLKPIHTMEKAGHLYDNFTTQHLGTVQRSRVVGVVSVDLESC